MNCHSLTTRAALFVAAAITAFPSMATAAITWNGNGGSNLWFDANNWSQASGVLQLPPGNGGAATDTQINPATTVEYDPLNDPNFATANSYTYPSGYGPTVIYRLYVSNNVDNVTTLNLRTGELSTSETTGTAVTIVGRTGTGTVNQFATNFTQTANNIDLGANQAAGANDGTWNYFGGNLKAGLGNPADSTTGGVRAGTQAATAKGTFNIHNAGVAGHVRLKNLTLSNVAGAVGTLGMFYGDDLAGNGGTRPIQVTRALRLLNGNAARLNYAVESNPDGAVAGSIYVPETVGLVDVAFGPGDGFLDASRVVTGTFYDSTGTTQLTEGSIISAVAPDGYTYRWTLSYTGNITWADAEISSIASITGAGTGRDVILLGLDSTKPAVVAIPGDYNNNGTVDAADYTVWADNFGRTGTNIPGDGNGSGTVDAADYTVWADNFGRTTPPGAAVPEPAALGLAFPAIALLRRRR